MSRLVALPLVLLWPFSALGQCQGLDLFEGLSDEDRASLRAAADAQPFANGNAWRARRGAEELIILGTLHLDDPRFDPIVAQLSPLLQSASMLLVEAGPAEMAELKSLMARDPSVLVNTDGPTMPELLPEDQWAALSAATSARGVPGFMAAKLRPWYISVLLSMPPCAMAQGLPNGLDQRLITLAEDFAIPIGALEPYDTILTIFEDGSPQDQIDMLTSAIAAEAGSEDMEATMVNLYFAEDAWMTWEFSKYWAQTLPGYDPTTFDAQFSLMEDKMMVQRNQSWIPVIEEALAQTDGPVLVAFGALHLAGEQGVLALLQAAGFSVERTPFQ